MAAILQYPDNPVGFNTWRRHVRHYLSQYNVQLNEVGLNKLDSYCISYRQNRTTGGALDFVQGWIRDRGIDQVKALEPPPSLSNKPTQEGLYLNLEHGRHYIGEKLNNWGFDGPSIGPLKYVHVTYMSELKYGFVDPMETMGFDHEGEITIIDSLIEVDGCYYGDWSVEYYRPTQQVKETVKYLSLLPSSLSVIRIFLNKCRRFLKRGNS